MKINNTNIKKCESVKYLGIWIDDNLTWKTHIEHVYSKISKFVGIFYKLAHKLPDNCLRNLYFAFVHPHIIYGIEIYANTFSSYLDKFKKLNNKLLRILQHEHRLCKSTTLYRKYNTLPIAELHQFHIICLIHKFIFHKDTLPKIYHTYFTENFKIHHYDTRNKNDLHLSTVKSCRGSKAINIKGCMLWNRLPDGLKTVENIRTFKVKLKEYMHNSILL